MVLKDSPFVSVQGALRYSPWGEVWEGVRGRRDVQEGVDEGFRLHTLGLGRRDVVGDAPALGKQAQGYEEEKAKHSGRARCMALLYFRFRKFVFVE